MTIEVKATPLVPDVRGTGALVAPPSWWTGEDEFVAEVKE